MKINTRHHRPAFTLIELMAVIVIIVILAGLVVGGLGYVNEKQARGKAQVQIALLSKALEEYKLDMGQYPPTNDLVTIVKNKGTDNSKLLYNSLFFEGYDAGVNPPAAASTPPKATKIYVAELDPMSSKQGWVMTQTSGIPKKDLLISDPWGNQYCYRSARKADGGINNGTQNPDFDLWSMGKNGESKPGSTTFTQNADDVYN